MTERCVWDARKPIRQVRKNLRVYRTRLLSNGADLSPYRATAQFACVRVVDTARQWAQRRSRDH
jgi:hypothetical protein